MADVCERPIELTKRIENTNTGEVRTLQVSRRCGSRLESQCPSCSALYRGDVLAVLQSGLETGRPMTFLTFTAPGADAFGAVHQRVEVQRKDGTTTVRRCPCGGYHDDAKDWRLGSPVSPETYRYKEAAAWNAASGRLLAVTMQKLSRIVGRRLQWARVAEFQTRGLVHFHVLVRGVVTDRAVHLAVRGGRSLRTGRTIAPAEHAGHTWGPQVDVQRILPGGRFGVGAYLVKLLGYAVKSAGDNASTSSHEHAEAMSEAGAESVRCSHDRRHCGDGCRLALNGDEIPSGKRTRRVCRRHGAARRGWGYRGHVFSKSRGWGSTLAAVRYKRVLHANGGQPPPEPPAHLVVTWERTPQGATALLRSARVRAFRAQLDAGG